MTRRRFPQGKPIFERHDAYEKGLGRGRRRRQREGALTTKGRADRRGAHAPSSPPDAFSRKRPRSRTAGKTAPPAPSRPRLGQQLPGLAGTRRPRTGPDTHDGVAPRGSDSGRGPRMRVLDAARRRRRCWLVHSPGKPQASGPPFTLSHICPLIQAVIAAASGPCGDIAGAEVTVSWAPAAARRKDRAAVTATSAQRIGARPGRPGLGAPPARSRVPRRELITFTSITSQRKGGLFTGERARPASLSEGVAEPAFLPRGASPRPAPMKSGPTISWSPRNTMETGCFHSRFGQWLPESTAHTKTIKGQRLS